MSEKSVFYLPQNPKTNLNPFLRIFHSTTNSYKYLFFKAILDSVYSKKWPRLCFKDLVIGFLSNAYYSLKIYHLNFGKQDRVLLWVDILYQEFKKGETMFEPS